MDHKFVGTQFIVGHSSEHVFVHFLDMATFLFELC